MRGPVRLSRKLVLEAATLQPDNAGGFTQTWAVLGSLWADIRPGAGRLRENVAVNMSSVPYRVIVRAAASGAQSRPKPGQRFREQSRVFMIEAVAEGDPDGMYLECFTKEEVLA